MHMDLMFENTYIQVLSLGLLLFWLIYLYFVKNYGYWEHLGIPHVPAVFPWGSMSEGLVFSKVHFAIAYDEFYKQFKGERFYGIIQVRVPCLVIRDPDLIQRILTIDSSCFRDRTGFEYNHNEYMLNSLFTLNGDQWKIMRKKLMPAYNSAKMKMIYCLLEKTSNLLKNHVNEVVNKSNDVDIEEVVSSYVIETVINCIFGADTGTYSSEMKELNRIIPLLFQWDLSVIQKLYMYNAFPIFKKIYLKRFEFLKPYFKDFLTNLVCKIVALREEHCLLRYDFLDLLIKIRQNKMSLEDEYLSNRPGKGERLTNQEIAGEILGFMAGSYQKPSSVMIFCLYQLSHNSEIQDKLCQEIKKVMARSNGLMTYQALSEMTYMDKVVKETMRLYPPLPILQRTCNTDYKVPNSDVVIQREVKVIIPTYSLHHDPDYFPHPEKFDPERFAAENFSKKHPFVFLPFGAGPRMCMGVHFGMMQIKAGLATILNDYEVTPSNNAPVEIKAKTYVIQTENPVKLILKRRTSSDK